MSADEDHSAARARPRLAQHLRCELVEGEGAYVLAEREQMLLRDELYHELIPLLDGTRTVEDILFTLQPRRGPRRVFEALARLRELDLLGDEADDEVRIGAAGRAFWASIGVSARDAVARLRDARVEIDCRAGVDVAALSGQLRELGISLGSGAQLRVVVIDDYLDPALEAINRRQLDDSQPWLLLRPAGSVAWLGPLFDSPRTGCWACLAHRLRGHRRIDAHLRGKTGAPGPFAAPAAALPSMILATLAHAASEIAKWYVAPEHTPLVGAVLTLDTLTLESRVHQLTRRPQCPACGRPPAHDPSSVNRVELPPAARRQAGDGTRTLSAAETVARLRHHVSPITGVVGQVRESPETHPKLTPVYVADHNFVDMDAELYFLSEGFRKRSGGKGTSPDQAMASALGESIERYCGVFQGHEPRLSASRVDLGDVAIEPNACMGYSTRQYAEREHHVALGSRVSWVPEPFDDERVIEWTPLWSLGRGEPRYLPTAYCYYGYAHEGPRFAVADSNGCAAGNTVTEAVLQGLLELVERDCVALWWYNRLRRPGVDLDSFAEPYIGDLRAHYRTLEREIWALDITSDLGVPAFAAISRRCDKPKQDIILGFGAHLDARVALLRALTELNQSLPSVPTVADDTYRGSNKEALRWWQTATVASEPYLLPTPEFDPRARSSYAPAPTGDLRDDILNCVGMLADRGLDTLVLDQTRPDIELRVVRVVVPGLRHFWPRFGPGRLYNVPVTQGWCEHPRTEAQLNPHVIYF